MKRKKSNLLILLLLLCSKSAYSQFGYGVEAGYSLSGFAVSRQYGGATLSESSTAYHGFQLGGIATYTISNVLWLESGLTFQTKGTSFTPQWLGVQNPETGTMYEPYSKIGMNYYSLDVPLLIGGKIRLNSEMSIIPKIGIFSSFGLGGKGITEGVDHKGVAFRKEYKLSEQTNFNEINPAQENVCRLKSGDSGLQMGIDFMWNKIAVRAAWKVGLGEKDFFQHRVRSQTISVSCAYYFKQ